MAALQVGFLCLLYTFAFAVLPLKLYHDDTFKLFDHYLLHMLSCWSHVSFTGVMQLILPFFNEMFNAVSTFTVFRDDLSNEAKKSAMTPMQRALTLYNHDHDFHHPSATASSVCTTAVDFIALAGIILNVVSVSNVKPVHDCSGKALSEEDADMYGSYTGGSFDEFMGLNYEFYRDKEKCQFDPDSDPDEFQSEGVWKAWSDFEGGKVQSLRWAAGGKQCTFTHSGGSCQLQYLFGCFPPGVLKSIILLMCTFVVPTYMMKFVVTGCPAKVPRWIGCCHACMFIWSLDLCVAGVFGTLTDGGHH